MIVADKRQLAAQHFINDDGEAVDVRAPVELFAQQLFRRHIHGGAEHEACLGQIIGAVVGDGLSDAEVEDFNVIAVAALAGDHDVVGLEVAVDDAERVGGSQRLSNLISNVDNTINRQHAMVGDDARKRSSVDVFHRQKEQAVFGDAEIINRHGVRVIDATGHLRFALEAGERLVAS